MVCLFAQEGGTFLPKKVVPFCPKSFHYPRISVHGLAHKKKHRPSRAGASVGTYSLEIAVMYVLYLPYRDYLRVAIGSHMRFFDVRL